MKGFEKKMISFFFGLVVLIFLFWLGITITGAVLTALIWLFIKIPIALIFMILGITCCITIVLIPVGLWFFKTGCRLIIPG